MILTVTVNGEKKHWDIAPDDYLLDVLRRNGFKSPKRGCDTGSCGACTVLLDGRPVLSCSLLAAKVQGHEVTTIEGVEEEIRIIAGYLNREGAEQCGYCSPGLVMTVLAMNRELNQPTEEQIRHYLTGNLCRCSGYMGQMRGILKYMGGHHENC